MGWLCEMVCGRNCLVGMLVVFLMGRIFQCPCGGKRGRCFGSPLFVIEIDCRGFRVGWMRCGL